MDLFVFVFLAGILAGLLIAGLLLCAFYLFTRKRGHRPTNNDIEMQENVEAQLSSSIPSTVESSAPIVLVDDETRAEFSYVHVRANRLGFGRYGVVYKGVCVQSQSEVAIKVVYRQQYGDEQRAHKYFEREVATLKAGSMVSANVLKLLGSVTNHTGLMIVTEYCENGNMSQWMDRLLSEIGDVYVQNAIVIEAHAQLANGLRELHGRGIVHRDLKASNILITSRAHRSALPAVNLQRVYSIDPFIVRPYRYQPATSFTVKIGDFGLARFVADPEDLTVGVGTLGYMAPEVRSGAAYGPESDLYSLGVMMKRDLERIFGPENAIRTVVIDDETEKTFTYIRSCANRLALGCFGATVKGTCMQDQSKVATKLVNRQLYADEQYAHLYFEVEVDTLKIGSRVSANVTKLLASDANRVSLVDATGDCGVVRDHLFHEVRPASPFAVKIGDFGHAHFADDPDDLTNAIQTLVVDDEGGKKASMNVRSCANRLGGGRFGVVCKGAFSQSQSEISDRLVNRQQYGDSQQVRKYVEPEVATLKICTKMSANVVELFASVTIHVRHMVATEYCEKGDVARWADSEPNKPSVCIGEMFLLEAYVQLAHGLIYLRALCRRVVVQSKWKGSNVLIATTSVQFVLGNWLHKLYPTLPATTFTVKIGDVLTRFIDGPDDLTLGVSPAGMATEVRIGSECGVESNLHSLGLTLESDVERTFGPRQRWFVYGRGSRAEFYQAVEGLTSADPKEQTSLAMMKFHMDLTH